MSRYNAAPPQGRQERWGDRERAGEGEEEEEGERCRCSTADAKGMKTRLRREWSQATRRRARLNSWRAEGRNGEGGVGRGTHRGWGGPLMRLERVKGTEVSL